MVPSRGFRLTPEARRMLAEAGGAVDRQALAQLATSVAGIPSQAIIRDVAGQLARLAPPPDLTFEHLVGPTMKDLLARAAELSAAAAPPQLLVAQLSSVGQLIAQVQTTHVPGAAQLIAQHLRVLDGLTPQLLQAAELAATADLARRAFGGTALETWRLSLLASADVARIAELGQTLIAPAQVEQLAACTRVTADLAARLAAADFSGHALLQNTAGAARAWQNYLQHPPTPHSVRMATAAGTAVGGLVGADLLRLPAERITGDDRADIDSLIVAPWQSEGRAAQVDLYDALAEVNPDAVGFLKGGWDDVHHRGAMAASKVAHCAVEALDHTLRALAPEAAVVDWVRSTGQPGKDYLHEGRPTRRGRVAYALRGRAGDRRLVQQQVEAVVGQRDAIAAVAGQVSGVLEQAQGIKHAPGAATVVQARTVLVSAEALLMQLVIR
ncbi:pPIWI-associating nuclease domain-containing protein [Blastococcus sp. SYSU DS1024]